MTGRMPMPGTGLRALATAVCVIAGLSPLSVAAQTLGDLIDRVQPEAVSDGAGPDAQAPAAEGAPLEMPVAETPAAGAPIVVAPIGDVPAGETLVGDLAAAVAEAGAPPDLVVEVVPEQITPDPITNDTIRLLQQDGLIARQQRINEGLLLMDRQLRQAQLVQQLMRIYGPYEAIEVSPGQFVDFSETPEGIRQQIALMDLQMQLAGREADLAQALTDSEMAIAQNAMRQDPSLRPQPEPPVVVVAPPTPTPPPAPVTPPPEPVVAPKAPAYQADDITARDIIEISGANGTYVARISWPGQNIIARVGDELPTGQRVVSIGIRNIVLEDSYGDREVLTLSE